MKMTEQQKIAAKLGLFDPVSEILKDEDEKLASVIENLPSYLDHSSAETSREKDAGASTKRLIYDKIWPEGKDYRIGGPKPMIKRKKKEDTDSDKKAEETTKEAQPPMGAPPMATGGGAPQMMPGAMPQMGGGMPGMGGPDPQAAAAAAMDEAAAAEADPIEHENETLRKMIENKKLKLELSELSNQVPGGTAEEAAGAAGAGTPEGNPMDYMRQALSQ